jgi:hypothetical protein
MLTDLSKFKRLFVFGCSFTSYKWPTWADILSKEMPNCEYYNFGQAGGGNLLINNRIAQANLKYKFSETDLVIVMFTSLCREDRYINNTWRVHGSVFNQEYYDKSFVKKYCDPNGYLVRDMALIEMSTHYLNSLSCTSLYLSIFDLDIEKDMLLETAKIDFNNSAVKLLKEIYRKLDFPAVVTENTDTSKLGVTLKTDRNELLYDGHPTPKQYLDFLLECNFPITDRSIKYVNNSMHIIDRLEYWDTLNLCFKELSINQAYKDINII